MAWGVAQWHPARLRKTDVLLRRLGVPATEYPAFQLRLHHPFGTGPGPERDLTELLPLPRTDDPQQPSARYF